MLLPKLKIVLQSKIFLFLLLTLVSALVLILSCKDKHSIYTLNDGQVEGKIIDYTYKGDKIVLTLKTPEKIIVNHYIKGDTDNLNFKIGQKIVAKGQMREPTNNTIPNTFNYKKYLYHKNIYYVFNANSLLVIDNKINILDAIRDFLQNQCLKLDKKGYMSTLIMGKKLIDEDTLAAFNNLGIIHLLSISGLHLAMFASLLKKMLLYSRLSDNKCEVLIDVFLFFYGLILDFPASVLRAFSLRVFLQLNKKFGLNLSRPLVLIYSSLFLIILNFELIYDIGFLFSTLSTFGLLSCKIDSECYLKNALITSFVATIWVMPLIININYSYNFLAPVFNLILVPFISYLFYPLALLTFVFPFLLSVFNIFIYLLETMVSLGSNINFLVIILPKMNYLVIVWYYLFLVLYTYQQRKTWFVLLILLVFLNKYGYNLKKDCSVYYLDVGQGDSSLIIMPNYQSINLIDTGGVVNDKSNYTIKNIIKFLNSININYIDNLILTHGDYDHIGNAKFLVDNIKVKNVLFNCGEFNEIEKNLKKTLEAKNIMFDSCVQRLNIGKDNKLQFLKTKDYNNENDNSNVIYFNYNNYKFLFMGDAGIERENYIMPMYNLENIDFLKVGHHGSNTSSGKSFIDVINPKFSIISVGKNNHYGHPKSVVLDNLSGSIIYRTDEVGSIEVIINKTTINIHTYAP